MSAHRALPGAEATAKPFAGKVGSGPGNPKLPPCIRLKHGRKVLRNALRDFAPVCSVGLLLLFGVIGSSACNRRDSAVSMPVWTGSSYEYAIGIMTGAHPMVWSDPDPALAVNPVITARDVTDVAARFVADPFMVQRDGIWHMFFETLDATVNRGVVSWATSSDGFSWQYRKVVLREPFHMSFPIVFRHEGHDYMVVESYQDDSVRLYRANPFPTEWQFVKVLLRDEHVDNSIFEHAGRWWMMTSPRTSDTLRLYHAPGLEGPWAEHPESPLIENNGHIARPGGRVIPWDGKLIRYPQDCWPLYGNAVHALIIEELTPQTYVEHPWPDNPILAASGTGWNSLGMHHIDPHRLGPDKWIAVVDGLARAQPDHRIDVSFENGARLLGFSLRPTRRRAGDPILLRFFWKDIPSIEDNTLAMFVHIRGEKFLFQADYHLSREVEAYERVVTIPTEAPPGLYRILVGLYELDGGRRLRPRTRLPSRRQAVVLPIQLDVRPLN